MLALTPGKSSNLTSPTPDSTFISFSYVAGTLIMILLPFLNHSPLVLTSTVILILSVSSVNVCSSFLSDYNSTEIVSLFVFSNNTSKFFAST